ncbi:MAG TPA: phenylalanine--tRNA ligase subunit alpha [Clostridiaceae bacterium]|nr:phenylalanine--tRNA ligase subunit alpha [Clostridiaceae bacterium]
MLQQIENISQQAMVALRNASSEEELQKISRQYMGKNGELTTVLKGLGALEPEARKTTGQAANKAKNMLQQLLEERKIEISNNAPVLDHPLDLTLPGLRPPDGGLHPITQMSYDLNDAFLSLGFVLFSESEISSELFAFDNLNFPPDHPARESMDTYWLDNTEDKQGAERLCLRPHLTGASVRYLRKYGAPARFIYPGRVYRNESTDARHERAFFQYEALIVEKDFPFASGRLLINTILEKVFGHKVNTRMRAGFFPFVEPGFEIDMECQVCGGEGCRVCKNVGWIEVMPGGTPHPNVLRAAGLDPNAWSGFYINIGLDRLVMMRYGVEDVRLFHSGDLRFLSQFR